ncbi:beta-glucosidase BglX [Sphingomonas psychrolutea]|uniref:beta-glucosidase n=1 Tax=Sphingomonas psychrolutea TaxID=1259676 RepID=A0ABQ1G672_9SPHN|nr:beta-glucosidase BglX [Sphingomonas psychrolutea]GGA37539.1 beta-glucosidase [Sphingomonas psychrolutea]
MSIPLPVVNDEAGNEDAVQLIQVIIGRAALVAMSGAANAATANHTSGGNVRDGTPVEAVMLKNETGVAARILTSVALGLAFVAPGGGIARERETATVSSNTVPISEKDALVRANTLLARMTIEEKVGQISQRFDIASLFPSGAPLPPGMPPLMPLDATVAKAELGALLFVHDPEIANKYQRIAVEQTRLKIPLLLGYDVIWGMRTMFPVPLAGAASFDPEGVAQARAVAAKEARALGIHWTFAPMIDIARDPRWGRIVEGAGEDPYLGAAMARAQVRGFQGDHIGAPGHIIAGPKHFVGYGAAVGGRDYDPVFLSDSELYNVYLPPFKAAIDAGAGNIMSAYMDLNDVPASANKWLLTDVLRGELGFKGWVVTDASAVHNLVKQGFATDKTDASARAILAGVDMEMSTAPNAFATLASSVRAGKVPMKRLDEAVRRVLLAKYRMGLFENPYVDVAAAQSVLNDPAHAAAAQAAAERSLVLLKNDGAALPLVAGAHQRVAVIGPMADSPRDTTLSLAFPQDAAQAVTVFKGVSARLNGIATVATAPGVQLARVNPSPLVMLLGQTPLWTAAQTADELQKAVALAARSDVVILTLGEKIDMSSEQASRSDLTLPGDQRKLLDAVLATGKPVVVVLMNGRPLDLTGVYDKVPAILEAWYPGSRGGTAVARALFGDVNPGGKTPVTWPRSVGQVPTYYAHNLSHNPEGQGTRYFDASSTPRFPFGFGLSYTRFTIAPRTLDKAELSPGGKVMVSTTLTNIGARVGDEVVQLYIHQRAGRASRPVRLLQGFQRVSLNPGESRHVSFTLDESNVRYWNSAERGWVIDPGVFDLWVGNSSQADGHITFTVGGSARAAK